MLSVVKAFLLAAIEANSKKDSYPDEKVEEEDLGFSTDIENTQGYCFQQGISGNCNSDCPHLGSDFCEC